MLLTPHTSNKIRVQDTQWKWYKHIIFATYNDILCSMAAWRQVDTIIRIILVKIWILVVTNDNF